MLEDLVLYHKLATDGEMRYSAEDLNAAAAKHSRFLLDGFSILDGNGEKLNGTLVRESNDQIDAQGVIQADVMKLTVSYRFRYSLATIKPKFLTFLQSFGGKDSVIPSTLDLEIWFRDRKEYSLPLAFSRPQSFSFDWERVYENKRPSFDELRKKRKEQLQASLGISSYTGIYSFLYINRFEVRHEVLIPVATLESWIEIPRRDPDFLDVDEQSQLKKSIESFVSKHCKLRVDSNDVEGKLARLNFFGLDIADFALNADPRRMSFHQARVGIIWSFPCRTTPTNVELTWDAFSEQAPFLSSAVLVEKQPPARHFFQANAPKYAWTGQLLGRKPEPILASSTIPEADRGRVIEQLLFNIYRAFDFRDDPDVYDALAASVEGKLLREVYLRAKQTLLMAEQGGSIAEVSRVQVDKIKPSSGDRFEVEWQVTSSSEHWGHVHTQTTAYKALLKLNHRQGEWKLSEFQLLDETKLKFETSIRGIDGKG
jgi:hypothetical protein